MNLFNFEIINWESWCKVFNSIKAFEPLIHHIFKIENLPEIKQITNLKPGTNAVFKADDKVIKIFVFITEKTVHSMKRMTDFLI